MTKEEAREAVKEAYGNSEYTDEIIKALEQIVTDDALDAVFQHIISMDKFNKEGFAGYDIPKEETDGSVCLCVFDKDKYVLTKRWDNT